MVETDEVAHYFLQLEYIGMSIEIWIVRTFATDNSVLGNLPRIITLAHFSNMSFNRRVL